MSKRIYKLYHGAFESQLKHVATATVDNHYVSNNQALERLYARTQNIDSSWVDGCDERGGVALEATDAVKNAGGCRSTAVGDVVVSYLEHCEDGECNRLHQVGVHVVSPVGFK